MEQTLSAVASVLPFVYKERCRQLCDEATNSHDPSPSLTEAFRQLRNQLRSPERAAAFIFQCLRGLGWREDLRELQRVADTGFSLEVTYLDIWRRLSEIKRDIVEKLKEIEVEIDQQLPGFYVGILRVALLGSLIHVPIEENQYSYEEFFDLFDGLLDTLKDPSLAASIVTSVLKRFKYSSESTQKLEQYRIPNFNLRQHYPEISLRLRVAEFFYTLREQDCLLAMMILSRLYLRNIAVDRITPLEFVLILFNRGVDSVVKIDDISKIQDLARSLQRPNFFNGYGSVSTATAELSSNGATVLPVPASTDQEDTADATPTTPLLEDEDHASHEGYGSTHEGATPTTAGAVPSTEGSSDQGAVPVIDYDNSNEQVKCLMTFMITPHHPEEADIARLEAFMSQIVDSKRSFICSIGQPTTSGSGGGTNNNGSDIPVGSGRPGDLSSSLYHQGDNGSTDNDNKTSCIPCSEQCYRWVLILLFILLAVFFVIFLVLGAVFLGLRPTADTAVNFTVPDNVTIAGTNPYPVLVPGEYSSLRLMLLSSDPVNITQIPCGDLNISFAPLIRYKYNPPTPDRASCLRYNANDGNDPINLAPGSQLSYNITLYSRDSSNLTNSSSNYVKDGNDCLFLYLVNSKQSNDHLLQCDDTNTPIVDQSDCLKLENNETSRTWLIQFNITEQADYYVVLRTPGLDDYGSDIEIKPTYYNISSDESVQVCQLSSNHSTCFVNPRCRHYVEPLRTCFDMKSNSEEEGNGMCLLVQSSSSSSTMVSLSPDDTDVIFDISSFSILLAALFSLVVSLVLMVLIIPFCCAYRRSTHSSSYDTQVTG